MAKRTKSTTSIPLLPIIGILFLLVALIVTIYLASQRQELRKKAAVPGGPAYFALIPDSDEKIVGQTLPVVIKLTVPTTPSDPNNPANTGFTYIRAVFSYTYSTTNPFTLEAGPQSNSIIGNLPSPWTYNFRKVTVDETTTPKKVTIEIEALYPGGQVSGDINTQTRDFATINMVAATFGTVTLNLDTNESEVRSKYGNDDLLSDNSLNGTYQSILPTRVQIKFKLQGMNNPTTHSLNKTVDFSLDQTCIGGLCVDTFSNINSRWQTGGFYLTDEVTLNNTGQTANNYVILIKSPGYLKKRINNLSINQGQLNLIDLTANQYQLLFGDVFNNDNKIKGNDASEFISIWTDTIINVANNPTRYAQFDWDGNGQIRGSDYNALISNWTNTEIRGDE